MGEPNQFERRKGEKGKGYFYLLKDFKPIWFHTLHFKNALGEFQNFFDFNHTFFCESAPNERERGLIQENG